VVTDRELFREALHELARMRTSVSQRVGYVSRPRAALADWAERLGGTERIIDIKPSGMTEPFPLSGSGSHLEMCAANEPRLPLGRYRRQERVYSWPSIGSC
jgi:hypothetical protein